VIVPSTVNHLDERHAGLDQAAGQQTTAAELVLAVGLPQALGLVVHVEGLRASRPHQEDRPVEGRLLGTDDRRGKLPGEPVFTPGQQLQTSLDVTAGRDEVLESLVRIVDQQRGMSRTQVTRDIAVQTATVVAIETGVDRDERRHLVTGMADLRRGDTADRGMFEGGGSLVTGVQEVLGVVVPVDLGRHRPHQHQVLHRLGQLWQVLDDVDPGHRCRLGGELALGLRVEGVLLAGAAVHPQQDARLLAGLTDGLPGQRFEPRHRDARDQAGGREFQQVAAFQVHVN